MSVLDVIRHELRLARQLASSAVPLGWRLRRNWVLAMRLLPERYDADVGAAHAIATHGMDIVFEGDTATLSWDVRNLVHSDLEREYVDCAFIEELWRGHSRVAGPNPGYGQVRLLTVEKMRRKSGYVETRRMLAIPGPLLIRTCHRR